MATGISDDKHALAIGTVLGALLKELQGTGYSVQPVTVENTADHRGFDYTKALLLTGPSGTKFVIEITPQGEY